MSLQGATVLYTLFSDFSFYTFRPIGSAGYQGWDPGCCSLDQKPKPGGGSRPGVCDGLSLVKSAANSASAHIVVHLS